VQNSQVCFSSSYLNLLIKGQGTVQSAVTTALEMLQSQLEFAIPFPVPMETDDLISIRYMPNRIMNSFFSANDDLYSNPSSFRTEFLNSLVSAGVLDASGAKSVQESWSEQTSLCPLLNEMNSQGQSLEVSPIV
jgi:hypothetical protein